MGSFKKGDRVRTTDTVQLSLEFRHQVGTIVDASDLQVTFDEVNNPAGLQGWYVPETCMVPWVDAPLDTPEDVERFLNA